MAKPAKIMVIDDEADMLENCRRLLQRFGYEVVTCDDGVQAVETIGAARPDLVLTDLKMPGKDGMAVLDAVKGIDQDIPVLFFTAHATVQSAVQAMKKGAYDYITKPFSPDELTLIIERALKQKTLTEENRRLRQQLEQAYGLNQFIGTGPAMQRVFRLVTKAARSGASILILGESGTGKELVAKSIHNNSLRADKPFIPVDCASLPGNLLESELFGHEKGAFTGAVATKPGIFELAQGGTLFLDEIGEMDVNLQSKLLRVLQEGQLRRVGGTDLITVDLRVVAATNRDLAAAVAENSFRKDLYYRINVISIFIPPLRERVEDIPVLAHAFLQRFREKDHKEVRGIGDEAICALTAYPWPGNVRELQNVIQRAHALTESEVIQLKDLPEHIACPAGSGIREPALAGPFSEARRIWNSEFEREYLSASLVRHVGNISQMAREAGIDRKTVYRLLQKHGIQSRRET